MADLFDLAVYAHWLLRLLLYGGGTGEGESSSSPPQALLPRSLSFCFFSVRFRLWVVFPWDPVRIFKQIAFIHLSLYQHSAQKRCINTSFTVLCQICVDAKVQNISVPVWGDLITETHAHTCMQLEGSLFQERDSPDMNPRRASGGRLRVLSNLPQDIRAKVLLLGTGERGVGMPQVPDAHYVNWGPFQAVGLELVAFWKESG